MNQLSISQEILEQQLYISTAQENCNLFWHANEHQLNVMQLTEWVERLRRALCDFDRRAYGNTTRTNGSFLRADAAINVHRMLHENRLKMMANDRFM